MVDDPYISMKGNKESEEKLESKLFEQAGLFSAELGKCSMEKDVEEPLNNLNASERTMKQQGLSHDLKVIVTSPLAQGLTTTNSTIAISNSVGTSLK